MTRGAGALSIQDELNLFAKSEGVFSYGRMRINFSHFPQNDFARAFERLLDERVISFHNNCRDPRAMAAVYSYIPNHERSGL